MSETPYRWTCPHCGQSTFMQIVRAQENNPLASVSGPIEELVNVLPSDLKALVDVSVLDANYVKVKPKRFLGKKRFASLAATMKESP